VIAADWGRGFAPYRSNTASLVDPRPQSTPQKP
jgi:hypothetical protein